MAGPQPAPTWGVLSTLPSGHSRSKHRYREACHGLICSLCLSETYYFRGLHFAEHVSSHLAGIGSSSPFSQRMCTCYSSLSVIGLGNPQLKINQLVVEGGFGLK